jgi:hypothetical protein
MKDILLGVRDKLRSSLDYVRGSDIVIVEGDYIMPASIKYPAIGIKDGAISYVEFTQDQKYDAYLVKIICFVQLQKNTEASIIGDDAAGQKGVMDVASDCITALRKDDLSGLVHAATPIGEAESINLIDQAQDVQSKIITIRYDRY